MMEERACLATARIREIKTEHCLEEPYHSFFQATAAFLERLLNQYDWLKEGNGEKASMEEWAEKNSSLYEDILPENYGSCYGNPAFSCEKFGKEMGRMLAFLYAEIHSQIASVYEQDQEELVICLELFLEIYQSFVCAKEEGRLPLEHEIREIIYWFISDYTETETEKRIENLLNPDKDFAVKIVMEQNLLDLRYLYRYGEYITENEKKLASYLNSLPEEIIRKMADTYTEGYRIGFIAGGKDIVKKKTVNIRYDIGFERLIRRAVENFRVMGLEPVIYRASESIFHKRGLVRIGYKGAEANRQFLYDHKEDEALFLDGKFMTRKLEELKKAYESLKELAAVHGGPACVESFGQKKFVPAAKPEACAMSDAQQKLSVEYASAAGQLVNEYIKGEERSFTIIAFPVPEIGKDFEKIFRDVIKINTLDYKVYQEIQQKLIRALDQASYVRVLGSKENRTNLKIMLHKLSNPEKETIFENCVADVNIPVGEVFTSPVLKGTEGILHVTHVFLNELEYKDLELTFQDGVIKDYRCSNFESEEECRKYIKDNVLFHHETLPIGEFAIGTNTTAYMTGRKYEIADKLPILIAEKTGPHFAVGDTCYSHSEELRVYNPDGKEIVAKENEYSLKRKEHPEQAYFNCHTDITIPYDELLELTAVCLDGREITIIREGRFVLDGCRELNKAFDVD